MIDGLLYRTSVIIIIIIRHPIRRRKRRDGAGYLNAMYSEWYPGIIIRTVNLAPGTMGTMSGPGDRCRFAAPCLHHDGSSTSAHTGQRLFAFPPSFSWWARQPVRRPNLRCVPVGPGACLTACCLVASAALHCSTVSVSFVCRQLDRSSLLAPGAGGYDHQSYPLSPKPFHFPPALALHPSAFLPRHLKCSPRRVSSRTLHCVGHRNRKTEVVL